MPLDVALDEDSIHPAASVTNDPFMSGPHDIATSIVDMEAASVGLSLTDSLPSVSEYDDSRTASWVQQRPPTDTGPDADLLTPSVEFDPVLGGLVGADVDLNSSTESHSNPAPYAEPAESDMGQRLTTRFGRVIRPVCRLIESMIQVEMLLGIEQVQSSVIQV